MVLSHEGRERRLQAHLPAEKAGRGADPLPSAQQSQG